MEEHLLLTFWFTQASIQLASLENSEPPAQGPMLLTGGWVPLRHLTGKTIPNRRAPRPT